MQIKVPSAFAGQADMPASMPLGNKKHLIGIIPNSLKGFRRILTSAVVFQRRYLRYSIISMYILSKSNIPEWVFPYPGRINGQARRTQEDIFECSSLVVLPTPPKASAGSTVAACRRAIRRSTTMTSSCSGLLPTPRSARTSAGLRSSTWPNSPATCNSSAWTPAPAA